MNSFTLVFTAAQVAIIDKALQQVPYFVAAPLIQEINQQLRAIQQTLVPTKTSAKVVELVGGDPYPEVRFA